MFMLNFASSLTLAKFNINMQKLRSAARVRKRHIFLVNAKKIVKHSLSVPEALFTAQWNPILRSGLDPFILFLIFKLKFKFIDFKKTKFKFIDFKKTISNSNSLPLQKLNSNSLTLQKLNSNLLTLQKSNSNSSWHEIRI